MRYIISIVARRLPPENEKRHAPDLLDKTIEATKGRVADPPYSSRKFRERAKGYGIETIIYRGEDALRVDKRFRVHGPEGEARS